jgi:hypothetical protein
MNQFINSVYNFAASEGAWASAYKGAYSRMTEINAQFSPMETTVYL